MHLESQEMSISFARLGPSTGAPKEETRITMIEMPPSSAQQYNSYIFCEFVIKYVASFKV